MKQTTGRYYYFNSSGTSYDDITEEIAKIKSEHPSARDFYISTEDGGYLEMFYYREESDSEYKDRLTMEKKEAIKKQIRESKKKEKELALLKKLKEKYEA